MSYMSAEKYPYMDWSTYKDSNYEIVYLPFVFEQSLKRGNGYERVFDQVRKTLTTDSFWECRRLEVKYFYKYIADKFNPTSNNCQCYVYRLSDEALQRYGIGADANRYLMHNGLADKEVFSASYRISDVFLHTFRTGINILSFILTRQMCDGIDDSGQNTRGKTLTDEDCLSLAEDLFHIKKINRVKLNLPERGYDDTPSTTLLGLAKAIVRDTFDGPDDAKASDILGSQRFFFFVNEGTERANVFVYAEVSGKDLSSGTTNPPSLPPMVAQYRKELFYLRNCYSRSFDYQPSQDELSEVWSNALQITWGVTGEAAVVLACPDGGRKEFLDTTFRPNVLGQYQLVYLLALHRKYLYYLLLTRFDGNVLDDVRMLEQFQSDYYEFTANFVFSSITEVVQYKEFFVKLNEIHDLENLGKNIGEPLARLCALKEREEAREEEERDERLNLTFSSLGFLAAVSALYDGFELVGGDYLPLTMPRLITFAVVIVLVALALNSLIRTVVDLMRRRKD